MTRDQVMQRRTHRALAYIQRKLERLELDHLRQLVLAQHDEIESLKEQLQIAEDDAHNSSIVAGMWQDIAEEREAGSGNLALGITREGQIGVVHDTYGVIPAVIGVVNAH